MNNKLYPFQKEMLLKIKETLHKEWKPIEGDDVPKSEYDTYALQVFCIINNENYSYEKGFLPSSCNEYKGLLNEKIVEIKGYIHRVEPVDIELDGDIEHCRIVADKLINIYLEYQFQIDLYRMYLYLGMLIRNQQEQNRNKNPNYSWLATRCFVEDLLKIYWHEYCIDQKESFVEEMADPIGEGGFLRICIKHIDKNIRTYNYKKVKEQAFIETVLADEATITYPGGHAHADYYDYTNGEYVRDNETVTLIKDILKNDLKIKYLLRGKYLISSGIWEEKSGRYYMVCGVWDVLSPFYWIRRFLGILEKEKEEVVIINWKKN